MKARYRVLIISYDLYASTMYLDLKRNDTFCKYISNCDAFSTQNCKQFNYFIPLN